MDSVVVTRVSLLNMQVCALASVPTVEVEAQANALSPAGTQNGWSLTDDESMKPVVCADNPDRLHYILIC